MMAKHFVVFYILALLMLVSVEKMMPEVEAAEICTDVLGLCNLSNFGETECKKQCTEKHNGTDAYCEPLTPSVIQCKCLYNC